MIVASSRLGDVQVPDDGVLDFGPGLFGFPDSPHFVLVEIEENDTYYWLQSATEPHVSFLVTRPWDFFPDYELDVPDGVQVQLDLDNPADSDIFVLLTVGDSTGNDDEPAQTITANLLGPIVVNRVNNSARQIVLDSDTYATKAPLVA